MPDVAAYAPVRRCVSTQQMVALFCMKFVERHSGAASRALGCTMDQALPDAAAQYSSSSSCIFWRGTLGN